VELLAGVLIGVVGLGVVQYVVGFIAERRASRRCPDYITVEEFVIVDEE
jgi:hypothetical protein